MEDLKKDRTVERKKQLSKDIHRILTDYYDAKHQKHPSEQTLFMELQLTAYEIIGSQYYAVTSNSIKGMIDKDDFIHDCLIRVSTAFKEERCKLDEYSNVFAYIVGIMKFIAKEYYHKYQTKNQRTISLETENNENEAGSLLDRNFGKDDTQRLIVLLEGLWDDLSHSIARNKDELAYMQFAILDGLILEHYSQREIAKMFHISEAAVSQKNKKLLNALRDKLRQQELT